MTNSKKLLTMKHEAGMRPNEEKYWTHWLEEFAGGASFPYDRIAGGDDSRADETMRFRLPDHVTARLADMSRKSQVMLFVILASAVASLLRKYTTRSDVVVGAPIFKPEATGVFLNTILPIRCGFERESTFKDVLMRMKREIAEADAHKDYPVELLCERIGSAWPSAGEVFPLFDVTVTVDTIHDLEHIRHIPASMSFVFSPGADIASIASVISYNPAKYEAETVSRIAEHLMGFLDKACFEPDAPIDAIDIVGDEEKSRLLVEFNRTDAGYPDSKTVHRLFEDIAQSYPDRIAVIACPAGEERFVAVSYEELDGKAVSVAASLRKKGAGPGVIVAVVMDRSLELLVGILSVLKAGAAYLPIEKNIPAQRLRFLLADSAATLLVSGDPAVDAIDPAIEVVNLQESSASYRGEEKKNSSVATPSDPAYIIYTSGSTGRPKGVMIEHRNVTRLFINDKFPFLFGPADVWTMFHSHGFDFSVWEIYGALLFGGRVVIVPRWTARDARSYWTLLAREQVTVVNQTPASFFVLMDIDRQGGQFLRALRYVIFGGEALLPAKVKPWLDKYPGARLVNMYGITETTVHVTYKEIGPDEIALGGSPIGGPLPTLSVYLLDEECALLPQGAVGEICVGGAGTARGYLNRPELTAAAFVENPLKRGDRLYRSGDLGKWSSNGELYYLGRADSQVKIRGFRVETGEIEGQLIAMAGIQAAVVTPIENRETDVSLCAYIVAEAPLPEQDIRNHLRQHIPEYMIPAYFQFIDKIPLTANGKINRNALPQPSLDASAYAPPRNSIEAGLVEIWESILGSKGRGKRTVGIDDNFFALGGHSLNAVALVSGIHKKFHVDIPLVEIFNRPVIRELGEVIAGAGRSHSINIEFEEDMDYYPISPSQKRLYTLQKVEPQSAAYNISMGVAIEGCFDCEQMRHGVQSIVDRHESLRTSFLVVGEEPVQKIHRRIEFHIEDLALEINREYSFDSPEVELVVRDFVRPFDLSDAPLLRVGLVALGQDRYILCFDVHHIVFDGTSLEIFRSELSRIYCGNGLSPVVYQYKDYVRWLNREHTRDIILKQKQYWLGEFTGNVSALELFTDFPRPAIQSFEGKTLQFESDRGMFASLKALSVRAGVSLHMLLFAVFTVFLNKISGQNDIVVGIPVKGRTRGELDSVIGLFVNTVAIRCLQRAENSFIEYLGHVKDKTLWAFENQDFQFDSLVECLGIRREMSRNPVFDVMFSMPNIDIRDDSDLFSRATFAPYGISSITAKFDLTLNAMEAGDTIFFSFNYCTKLFKDKTIALFRDLFNAVLSQAVSNPAAPLRAIDLHSAPTAGAIFSDCNPADSGYRDRTLIDLLEDRVARMKDATAVACGATRQTYGGLRESATRIAASLLKTGTTAGEMIAVVGRPIPRTIETIFGVLYAGCGFLAIDPSHHSSSAEEILPEAVIVVERTIDPASAVDMEGGDEKFELPGIKTRPDDLAYGVRSSGASPHLAAHTHRRMVVSSLYGGRSLASMPGDAMLLWLPAASFAFVPALFACLFSGTAVVLAGDERLPGAIPPRSNGEIRISHVMTTPLVCAGLLKKSDFFSGNPLRQLILTGAVAVPGLLRRIRGTFPKGEITGLYGAVETAGFVAVCRYESEDGFDRFPVYTPNGSWNIDIVDPQGRSLPVGIPGELVVGEAGDKAATVRTGDWARWTGDGTFEFLGKIASRELRNGFWQDDTLVENTLFEYDGVEYASIPSTSEGKDERRLFFTAAEAIDPQLLKEFLSKRVPQYMRPDKLIQVDEMPANAAGLVDEAALWALAPSAPIEAPVEAPVERSSDGDIVTEALLQSWKEVLGVERLTIYDDYFDLGGDSMKALKIITKLEARNMNLDITDLFFNPTIKQLQEFVKVE